jgi:sugar (pentulose or hexulose) kinase
VTTTIVLGLDVGSTNVKALATTADGEQLHHTSAATPWVSLPGGRTEMAAGALVEVVSGLLWRCIRELEAGHGPVQVAGIGVSGMAESGALLDAAGRVAAPVMAWFDLRGGDEIAATPASFRAEFPRRTGLPVSALASVAKLLHLRRTGIGLDGRTWLNVPELVVHALGGERVRELSLSSRTGLLDQDDATCWPQALEVVGVDAAFLPPPVYAGDRCGSAGGRAVLGDSAWDLPAQVAGATLTVAGHDHLVAAVAAGAVGPGQLYDSMGTAEALVRVLESPLPPDARERLAGLGINALRHVVRDRSMILVGTRSGLLLRRVLQLVGVTDAAGRAALDRAVMALPIGGGPAARSLEIRGARNDDGVLEVRAVGDGLSPAVFFAAALEHGTQVCLDLLAEMDREVGPPDRTLVSGGWSRMECVRRSRSSVLPQVTFSPRSEETAFGAALFGAYAAAGSVDGAGPLPDFADTFRTASTVATGTPA